MSLPKIRLITLDPRKQKADLLVLPVYAGELGSKKKRRELLDRTAKAFRGQLEALAKAEKFTGKNGEVLELPTQGKLPVTRLRLVGLGRSGQKSSRRLRVAVAGALRVARSRDTRTVIVAIPEDQQTAMGVRGAAEGAVLGAYAFDRYLSPGKDKRGLVPVREVALAGNPKDEAQKAAAALGFAIAEATCMARDLVNEPAGEMTPLELADRAKALAAAHGLKYRHLNAAQIQKENMGMFWGVARGSDIEPRLIVLEYQPKQKTEDKGIALVGKGVTFDSGGYDLKGPAFMLDMKMDMGGAAAVISVMRAVAEIAPPFPVVAYAGACENLVSGHAYKPGDVLKSRKGKTVEINNTDAEGRLVLGDVLDYACSHGHKTVIDVATLTGAAMVALGPYTVGLLSNDDALASSLKEASKAAGEDFWRMPLNPALREQLKSSIADLRNTGERFGGCITAALFLENFVGEGVAWAHLDIAGPAYATKPKGVDPKGGTGASVRTLAQLILDRMSAS
ncbi:MAG: leucyl aminopeptidase [Deltaproteobacteria bacterium]|nr:leucyl aminopeptidase [Deltaproteobacteria bacterium]